MEEEESATDALLRLHHGQEIRTKLFDAGAVWRQLRTRGLGSGVGEDVLRAHYVRKLLGARFSFIPPELGLAVTQDSLRTLVGVIRAGGRVPMIDAVRILQAGCVLLAREKTVGRMQGDVVVVGDIHGQVGDLLYILDTFGLPGGEVPATNRPRKYIFNGDYVDRGNNGCEVFLLVLLLKICHPRDVHINRGNHEAEAMNILYGFYDECISKYGHYVYTLFRTAFQWLPLCCIIGQPHNVFVVHGGLYGVNRVTVSEIDSVPRGPNAVLRPRQQLIMKHSLWSDPGAKKGVTPSPRGEGVLWGEDATQDFLKCNPPLKMVVRSHQFPGPGTGWLQHHSAKVLTVFSASNYAASEYEQTPPAAAATKDNASQPLVLDSGKPTPMAAKKDASQQSKESKDDELRIHPRMRTTNRGSVFVFEEKDREASGGAAPPAAAEPHFPIYAPEDVVRCAPQWTRHDEGTAQISQEKPAACGADPAAPPPALHRAPRPSGVAVMSAQAEAAAPAEAAPVFTSGQRYRAGERDATTLGPVPPPTTDDEPEVYTSGQKYRQGAARAPVVAEATAPADAVDTASASSLSVFTWSSPLLRQDNPRHCVINPHTRQAFQWSVPYGAHCKGRGVDPVLRVVNHVRNSCALYSLQLTRFWESRLENPAAKGTPQALISMKTWFDGIASVVNLPQCKVLAPYLEAALKNRGFVTPQNQVRYAAFLQQALQLCNARPAPGWHTELLSLALHRALQLGSTPPPRPGAEWRTGRLSVSATAARAESLPALRRLLPEDWAPGAAAAGVSAAGGYFTAADYRALAAAQQGAATPVRVTENTAKLLMLHHVPELPPALAGVVGNTLRGGAGVSVLAAASLTPQNAEVLQWIYSPPLHTRVGDEDMQLLTRLYQQLLVAYKREASHDVQVELLQSLHHLTACAVSPKTLDKVLQHVMVIRERTRAKL